MFVSAHTLTAANAAYTPAAVGRQENFFPQTSAVRFQVYAVDLKTSKVVTAKDAKYFYVSIPNQPNVKLAYGKAGTGAKAPYIWTRHVDDPRGVSARRRPLQGPAHDQVRPARDLPAGTRCRRAVHRHRQAVTGRGVKP